VGVSTKDRRHAATYVAMIPLLSECAREVGYALAVHGTLGRDLDLVAIPWTEDAVSAEALILRLLGAVGWRGAHLNSRSDNAEDPAKSIDGDRPQKKPHGRLAWSIHFENAM
jgi:hypothetical protein